ncbi:MAG: DUF4350 domain-containing protein [Nocardioides sp.]
MTALSPTGLRGRLARHRSTLLIAGGLVLGVFVVLVLGGTSPRTSEPLDPDNPAPDGARALARVLDDQGVDVRVVRSADLLEDTAVDDRTTVLVTSTDSLGQSTADRLGVASSDALLVLAAPGPHVSGYLGYEPGSPVADEGIRSAECAGSDLGALVADLEIDVAEGAEYPAPAGCYFGAGGALVAQPEDGVLLLGAVDLLRNGAILEADNAAAALRLLGQRERLVWYVPDLADVAASESVSLSSLLPAWIRPGLWLVALTTIALVVWRGRRLGALVTEPLPVVVKAIETTRSRGRLYRKANDRSHAAGALRTAGRAAAAERLRLPSRADPDTLVRDVARHLGRPIAEVGGLLHPGAPVPPTDHDLVDLATALAELDRELRRT